MLKLTSLSNQHNQLKKLKRSLNLIGLLVLGKSSLQERLERPMQKQKEKGGLRNFLIVIQMRTMRPSLITRTWLVIISPTSLRRFRIMSGLRKSFLTPGMRKMKSMSKM